MVGMLHLLALNEQDFIYNPLAKQETPQSVEEIQET